METIGKCKIPAVGFGLWKLEKEDTAGMMEAVIKAGYRHIDSAADYGNEVEAGQGINSAIKKEYCKREDLWITSKLWNTDHDPENVAKGFQKTLDDLKQDYLDLYLIHFPISLKHVPHDERYPAGWLYDNALPMQIDPVPIHETWAAMEELVHSGKAKHIGICNFNTGLMHDLLSYAKIKPSVLQIESHPLLTQEPLIRLCDANEIAVTAFSPLGALSYIPMGMADENENVLNADCVIKAAQRTGKSSAQVVLRWAIQRGTAIIPKTSNPNRLKENISLFDFTLTDEEMMAISALNQNKRFNDPGVFCEQAFGLHYPIYD